MEGRIGIWMEGWCVEGRMKDRGKDEGMDGRRGMEGSVREGWVEGRGINRRMGHKQDGKEDEDDGGGVDGRKGKDEGIEGRVGKWMKRWERWIRMRGR